MAVKKPKVIVAMSGGVDSSVAAYLLQKQGYEVLGIFMHFWAETLSGESEVTNKCCSVASFNDARRVAQHLGFPIYTVNFDLPFKKLVVDEFIAGYGAGETPNPCVNCNKYIKFDLLIEKANGLRADFIATGHYAGMKRQGDSIKLTRPKDKAKDQTYFLYNLNQDNLKKILFPLSDLTKTQVREIAGKAGLGVAEKPESQEICFIPERTHNEFLKRHLKLIPGEIKTMDGRVIGKHQGLPLYTIGQRKGVEIGGIGPFYVAKCDFETNTLFVVSEKEDKALFRKDLVAREVNWINGEPKLPLRAQAVIRYRHPAVTCDIKKNPSGGLSVKFTKPQRAVTAGQSVVFYKGNEVLGGGIIDKQLK